MASACVASNGNKKKYERLTDAVRPSHYDLSLNACLKNFVLTGRVSIDLDVSSPQQEIKLHAEGLQVKKADLKLADGKVISDLRAETTGEEMLILHPPSAIPTGKATLHIDFVDEIGTHMKGFYRSVYKAEDGSEKVLASTQFESTFARKAFPCFDEPAFKATFDVQLTVDKALTALSNMNVVSESAVEGDKKAVKFARTPIMSTYLLAFAVGDLEYVEGKTKGGVDVRVYSLPGKKDQGHFALGLAIRALDWYGDWFGIPYVLPKCDLIAIPDFHMGAMENWGLVTFREAYLLYDPVKTSSRQKSYIALFIAHELAHLWFGDLVTMVWWTDLWLKEGFASFMEYLFVGHNYDEYKIWMEFARTEISSGMNLDALRNSHPIEVSIDNPNELDEIYDSITYAKSNCVNRMLCEYLGEETFQAGLRVYLKRFQYKNATTRDLWEALTEASGQDINKMMSGWTQQMGFPLVTVEETKSEGTTRVLSLKQKRFIVDGSNDETASKWSVPITTLIGPANTDGVKTLLTEAEGTITVDGVPPGAYVKLNARTGGFYRVAYSEPMFETILKAFHSLPALDRYGFAADCFALLVSGNYSAAQFLALVGSCSAEQEYAVWGALEDGIGKLSNVLSHADEALKKRLDAFLVKTLVPLMDKLTWEASPTDDSQRGQLRAQIISRLARCGHEATIQAGMDLFNTKKADINADIRTAVFGIVARNGTAADLKELQTIFETCGFSEMERNCIVAMAQTQDKELLNGYFDYAIRQGKVRSQDLMLVFGGAAATRFGQESVWEFFKAEQTLLSEKLGGAKDSLYQSCFKNSSDGFCSEARAVEVENLFCNHPDRSSLDRPIRQVTEKIRVNERLLSTNAKSVDAFLASRGF